MKIAAFVLSATLSTALLMQAAQAVQDDTGNANETVQDKYSLSTTTAAKVQAKGKSTAEEFSATVVLALKDDIKVIKVDKPRQTLGELLIEDNINPTTYRTESGGRIDLALPVKNLDAIFLFEMQYESSLQKIRLPYNEERLTSSTLEKGEEEVLVEGRPGLALKTTTIESDLSSNKRVNKNATAKTNSQTVESLVVISPPREKKVLVGTREPNAITDLARTLGDYTDATIPKITFWPATGPVTSEYGSRVHPITGVRKLHDGLDIGASCGAPAMSVYPGVVISAKFAGGYGNRVEVDHGNGLITSYNHLSKFLVKPGDKVEPRAIVGSVGSTGYSTGCHLHFMIEVNGDSLNPEIHLPAK